MPMLWMPAEPTLTVSQGVVIVFVTVPGHVHMAGAALEVWKSRIYNSIHTLIYFGPRMCVYKRPFLW